MSRPNAALRSQTMRTSDPPRRATYADLEKVPSHKVAELINGVLHVNPRPAPKHAKACSELQVELGHPFGRDRGGPGGWLLLFEPELHLAEDVLVPDIAGWRNERMPTLPDDAYFTMVPDWVCEVLSPSTCAVDRSEKLPIYAAASVAYAWLVDPVARTLEALKLEGGGWKITGAWRDDARVRAEPFDAIELELGVL